MKSVTYDDISNHHLIQNTINVPILSMHNKMQNAKENNHGCRILTHTIFFKRLVLVLTKNLKTLNLI